MLQLYPHLQQSLIDDIVKLHPHTSLTLSLSTKTFHRKEICDQKEFLRQVIERGSMKLCQLGIELRSDSIGLILAAAAKIGDIEICRWAIELGANDFNKMNYSATVGGHDKIAQLAKELIERNA